MNQFFNLVKFEYKKIFKRKITIVGIVAFMLFSIISGQLVNSIWRVENQDSSIDMIAGKKAVDLQKTAVEYTHGFLDEALIGQAITDKNQILQRLSEEIQNEEHQGADLVALSYARLQEYQNVSFLISSVLSQNQGYTMNIVDDESETITYTANPITKTSLTEEDAKNFYSTRDAQINDELNSTHYIFGDYTQEEQEVFQQRNDAISTPFQYGYRQSWYTLLNNAQNIALFLTVLAIIILSSVFSGEYVNRFEQMLLTTKNGVGKTAFAKVFTSLSLITMLFITGYGLNFLVTILHCGVDGWNLPIQLEILYSVYDFTMLEAYLCIIGVTFAVVMAVSCSVLCYSAIVKSPFVTVITNALIFLVPVMIPPTPAIGQLQILAPALSLSLNLEYYNVYHIFGVYIDQIIVFLGVSLLTMLVFIPLTYYGYKHQKVG